MAAAESRPEHHGMDLWTAPDVMTIGAAIYLVLSPWMFRYADDAAATWSAVLSGILLGVIVFAKPFWSTDRRHWAGLALGVWTMIAPWVIGFDQVPNAAGMHVFAGLVAAMAAALQLWARYIEGAV